MGNFDFNEISDQVRITLEIHDPVVLRAPGKFRTVFFGVVFDQDALMGAHHSPANRLRMGLEFRLKPRKPLELFFTARVIGQLRGR